MDMCDVWTGRESTVCKLVCIFSSELPIYRYL